MFDTNRFLRLARAHWAEQRRAYGWFFALGMMVHFVVILLFMAGVGYNSLQTELQSVIYFTGLYLSAPMFAARYFQHASGREAALVYLMRPASVTEKWLLMMLVVAIGYPVLYTLAFQVCNLPAAWISAARAVANTPSDLVKVAGTDFDPAEYRPYLPWSLKPHDAFLVLAALSSVQGFAAFGAAWFNRSAFAKTLLLAFVLLLVQLFLTSRFDSSVDLLFTYFDEDLFIPRTTQLAYTAMWILLPALLWFSVLVTLREKEAL